MAARRQQELEEAGLLDSIAARQRETHQADHQAQLTRNQDLQKLELEQLSARVEAAALHAQAVSPRLVQALERLGDEQLLCALSENFADMAAVEGRGLLETARKFLDFVPAGVLPVLKSGEEDAA